jgi:hypothetical protein
VHGQDVLTIAARKGCALQMGRALASLVAMAMTAPSLSECADLQRTQTVQVTDFACVEIQLRNGGQDQNLHRICGLTTLDLDIFHVKIRGIAFWIILVCP